jgi:ABC-2 type transport system permease protein
VSYHVKLYLTYAKVAFKRLMEYRSDFLIAIASSFTYQAMTILFLTVIFGKMRRLVGWSFYEVLLIYGLLTTSLSICGVFLDMPWKLHSYIRTGGLDIHLVRPANLLLQLIGDTGIQLFSIGHASVGLAAVIVALGGLRFPLTLGWALYLLAVIISGVLMVFSVNLMIASVGYWLISVRSIMYPAFWFSTFAQFPVVIYSLPIRFALTWVLPYAMAGFYPAAFMLRGADYRFYGSIAPLLGFFMFGCALLLWRSGIKRYQSTGS